MPPGLGFERCKRSLADYLELKRKKFPRFYFLDSTTLIDLLSSGRHPPAVQNHFSKFTDNIAGIEWKTDTDGTECGIAMGMYSVAGGEHVSFGSQMVCDGPVEEWLASLMEHTASSLRDKLQECVTAFVELPRDKWLHEYCCQLDITTSQIWWTTEVNAAFDRLEQASENGHTTLVSIVT